MRPIHGNWKSLPGSFDTLNALGAFESSEAWGIPIIPKPQMGVWPIWMECCDDWPRMRKAGSLPADGLGAIHFFTDDYRFEPYWKNQHRGLARWEGTNILCSPDFSLYRDHPYALQLWNTYRNRWMGKRFVELGRICIPTISWSDEQSYDFCFLGVEIGSVVIISTVGTQGSDAESKRLFISGYQEMIARIQPEFVYVHGQTIPSEIEDLAPIKQLRPFQLLMAERIKLAPKFYEDVE